MSNKSYGCQLKWHIWAFQIFEGIYVQNYICAIMKLSGEKMLFPSFARIYMQKFLLLYHRCRTVVESLLTV